jgi:glycosyltransferase involved in cell wall biosynthesis
MTLSGNSKVKMLYVAAVPLHLYAFWIPYAQHFRRKGWVVDAASANLTQFGDLHGVFDRVFDIQFIRNPLRNPLAAFMGLFSTIKHIRNLVTEQGYDIVHVSTPTAAFVVRIALRGGRNVKVIYTAHGFHFFKGNSLIRNLLFHRLERMTARWTDALITINREDFDAAKSFGTISPAKVRLVPGIGVNSAKYRKAPGTIRQELGLQPQQPLLLMIGEMIPRKRHKDAIDAFSTLPDVTTHMAFAGDGRLRRYLEDYVCSKGLSPRVHFLGFRQDIPALLSTSDALLLPSKHEGLPRCILEAMCVGTPVIASDIRGCRDLLTDDCGLLHPVGDIKRLSGAIREVLDNKQLQSHLTTRAAKRVKECSQDILIARHEEIYDAVLADEPLAEEFAFPRASMVESKL